VGISYELYHSLELGRAALTQANADRIFDCTGVAPTTLDPKRSRCALAFDGKPYSQEAWQSWQRYIENEADEWPQVTQLLNWTHFLCDVARKAGQLRQTRKALVRALRNIANECGLERVINDELGKIRISSVWRFSYGELRKSPLLADLVGFKDRAYKDGKIVGGEEIWEKTRTWSPQWDPCHSCPVEVTARLKPPWPRFSSSRPHSGAGQPANHGAIGSAHSSPAQLCRAQPGPGK
jgi:hypothetical protein